MVAANFRFHDDLDFFLDHPLRGRAFTLTFEPHQSLKHLIESLGVPHVELGLLRVNGSPAEGSTLLHDGDQVDVHGFEPRAEPDLRFLLDNHLGRLAAYLRMLGLDSKYRNDYDDPELARVACEEDRILLSRDRRLLMHNAVRRGCCPHSLTPANQLKEIAIRYGITPDRRLAPRCLECNLPLEPVDKQDILDRLEPLTRKYYFEFTRCPGCEKIYWKGSHWERMESLIRTAFGQ